MKILLRPMRMPLCLLLMLLCAPTLQAKEVSEAEAANIAKKFIHVSDKGIKRIRPVLAAKQKPSEQPYYIFTGADGKGFVIVSADDVARPILGYSTDAEISADGQLPLPMEQWLASVSDQIMHAKQLGISQSADIAKQWLTTGEDTVVVQLETAKWNQGAPYHDQCPMDSDKRSYTGCTITAYATLMKYYGYPTTGIGTTPAYVTKTKKLSVPERDIYNHHYDWDNMPMTYEEGNYTPEQANNVATLMADIGAALQADYSQEGTGSNFGLNEIYKFFDFFPGKPRLKDTFDDETWHQMLREELDKNRPIPYRAIDAESGGHAFILDGYTVNNYFSINWGWGGKSNGYFTFEALNPSTHRYSTGQTAYFDCIPMPYYDTEYTAQIDSIKYPSLSIAIDNVPEGLPTTIQMRDNDVFRSITVPENKDITVILNDKSLSTTSGIYNRGRLSIIGSDSSQVTVENNNALFSNYGILDIQGGTYKSTLQDKPETDYRRCIWTEVGSQTHISDATMESGNQTICTRGQLTIESGKYTCTDAGFVVLNTCKSDSMVILDGEFSCVAENGRCIYANNDTYTHISNGTFKSKKAVIITYGKLTIESGDFNCIGNDEVVGNCCTTDTVTILDGNFINNAEEAADGDYRRCLWTAEDSKTFIGQASFKNIYGPQTLCFNGSAIIDGAEIDNENGTYGCLLGQTGYLEVEDCRLSAKKLFHTNGKDNLFCRGGLYSGKVASTFIAEGYECVANTQEETSAKYPYMIQEITVDGIHHALQPANVPALYYNTQGIQRSDLQKGLNIIRKSDGKTVKVVTK